MPGNPLTTLGLAYRAGRVLYGADSVEQGILRCKALLLSADAGGSLRRNAAHLADKVHVPLTVLPYSSSEIGHALGKRLCALLALTDVGFYKAIIAALPRDDTGA